MQPFTHPFTITGVDYFGKTNLLTYYLLNSDLVENEIAIRGITRTFSPPGVPHFGGAWERVVKSTKTAFKIILQEQTVTDELLSTVLASRGLVDP